jgi:hypothetical protein
MRCRPAALWITDAAPWGRSYPGAVFARPPRAVAALTVAAALAVLATGCTGSPAAGPSTPAPLTDEQAFAAAEQTYRAYVDALNQVDLSDPATFEPVYALTTGDANAAARKSFSQMSADGWQVSGESRYDGLTGLSHSSEAVQVEVCLDVTDVTVLNENGDSVVPAERRDRQPVRVTFEPDGSLISTSEAIESDVCG